ncbi:hypothetical protein K466DRAFT_606832 [Polyporus arcularius HHB13444]|uniref:DUF6533 domain-containing protein n=1 Tax=Polyporus arcularius HHB13444 TaxID=1314778 RepID=A0A5C3NM73_9APHY|nr:hypothetical protein K466DRAFT_606832 [Polyporus arcularius HHB13444]
MSSDVDAATVALFDSIYTSKYCAVAAAVLFIYDTFLTFDREVTYFWTEKRVSGASLLFFTNKWISMTCVVMTLVEVASLTSNKVSSLGPSYGKSDQNQSCSMFVIAEQAMLILQFVPAAGFSALRAYALSGTESKLLGLLVAILSLAPVGSNLDRTVVIVSRVPLIAADIILIYITWTKLRGWATLTDFQQSKRLSLQDVLFRGGILYFVILFFLNVLHLALSATAVASGDSDNAFSVITVFTAPITAILISRFLLELQGTHHMVIKLDTNDPLHFSGNAWDSTLSFISPIGGLINPELAARSDDDDGVELQDRMPSEEALAEEEEGVAHTEVPEAAASSSFAP